MPVEEVKNLDPRQPANDRLIVEEVNAELKTKGGIIISEAFETTVKKTRIVAVSSGTKYKYHVGHYAWVQKEAGIELPDSGLVISEGHILFTTEE
jgi:Chaperonin 10 Kd subunit